MTPNETKIKHSQEYWDVKKSGKRLMWRMSQDDKGQFKTFKVTEDDFNALKSVLGYINRIDDKTVLNNQLFAKLYIMELVGQIRENKTTIFNKAIFTNISNQLKKPLELFYKAFYEDLCSNQLDNILEKNIPSEETQDFVLDYKRFKETFSLDYVTGKINEMINTTLHRRS
tara:strand:+ start:87 stop:599 length:513 start_codon:yes stop_codon:yes gene_type:complete